MPSQMTTAGKEISHVNGTELSQTYLQIVQVVVLLFLLFSTTQNIYFIQYHQMEKNYWKFSVYNLIITKNII